MNSFGLACAITNMVSVNDAWDPRIGRLLLGSVGKRSRRKASPKKKAARKRAQASRKKNR